MRAALLATVLLAGCAGATGRIATSATEIRAHAESSRERFGRIGAGAASGSLDADAVGLDASEGAREQSSIIAATDEVVRALPGVRDIEPWWARLVAWALVALSALALALLLWMTGIGEILRRSLAALGLFIPARVRTEANLAADVVDESDPAQARELVAAMRASDPVFDEAFRRARRRGKGAGRAGAA